MASNPSPFLVPEYMSEEVSGPEKDGNESVMNWKKNMAILDGRDVSKMTDEDLGKLRYLEIVAPAFRSEEVSRKSVGYCRYVKQRHSSPGYTSVFTSCTTTTTPTGLWSSDSSKAVFTTGCQKRYLRNLLSAKAWFDGLAPGVKAELEQRGFFKFAEPPGFGKSGPTSC